MSVRAVRVVMNLSFDGFGHKHWHLHPSTQELNDKRDVRRIPTSSVRTNPASWPWITGQIQSKYWEQPMSVMLYMDKLKSVKNRNWKLADFTAFVKLDNIMFQNNKNTIIGRPDFDFKYYLFNMFIINLFSDCQQSQHVYQNNSESDWKQNLTSFMSWAWFLSSWTYAYPKRKSDRYSYSTDMWRISVTWKTLPIGRGRAGGGAIRLFPLRNSCKIADTMKKACEYL